MAGNGPDDRFGKPDKITIEIAPLAIAGQWEVGILLENDEELAAITVPLVYGKYVDEFTLDSVIFRDTRISYFALKTTNHFDSLNTVLVGLLANLGDNRPPLAVGRGPVARLYFTQTQEVQKTPLPLVIDSTFFPPYNNLELVSGSAAPIRPIFETVVVEKLTGFDRPKPEPKKKTK